MIDTCSPERCSTEHPFRCLDFQMCLRKAKAFHWPEPRIKWRQASRSLRSDSFMELIIKLPLDNPKYLECRINFGWNVHVTILHFLKRFHLIFDEQFRNSSFGRFAMCGQKSHNMFSRLFKRLYLTVHPYWKPCWNSIKSEIQNHQWMFLFGNHI